jgi:hypothetical protein
MKYAMVIVRSDDEWKPLSEIEREFDSVVRWWADLRARGKIVSAVQLGPPREVASVSWRGGAPIVTDGPYVEAKEAVGGFVLLDVESAAEAAEIAASWPHRPGIRIEVRPAVMDPYG